MNVLRVIAAAVMVAGVSASGNLGGAQVIIGVDTAAAIAQAVDGAQDVTEDSALWDCRIHGNRVCGPGSGYPPGRYDRGALVAPWAITPAGLETDTGEYVGGYN